MGLVHGVYLLWCGTIATHVTSRYLKFWYLVHSQPFHMGREYGLLAGRLKGGDAHALRQA